MNKISMDKDKKVIVEIQKNVQNLLKNKFLYLLILIVNIILIVIVGYILFIREGNFIGEDNTIQDIESDIAIVNTIRDDEQEKNKIKVHITGEVKNSGIYELEEGARISDSIEKAGGITTNGDLSKVNLAYQIADGQKIVIPSIKQDNIGNYIIENSGENVVQEEKDLKDKKININTASASELMTLPGIGSSTAEKIINYRNENGKFKNIEDIKNISGIGDNKYNQLKEFIKAK